MARTVIVTRAEVLARYPDAPEDFVPTHEVTVLNVRTNSETRCDFVHLSDGEGEVTYAHDGNGEELYGVLSTGLWQCLQVHGRVQVRPVRYHLEYTAPLDREGFVYFVQSGGDGPIKIGWTQDLDRRIGELQTANAHPLRLIGHLPGSMRDEGAMHARFGHLRMEAEWFRNSPEIHAFLRLAVKTL